MVHITPGFTWSDTDGLVNSTMTSDNLHTLLDGAVVTGVTMGEFDTVAKIVQVSASVPANDQGEGSFWWDTTNNYLRKLRGAAVGWDPFGDGPRCTNNTGSAIPTGMSVSMVEGSDQNIAPTVTGGHKSLGIVQVEIAAGAAGDVKRRGRAWALCNGPVTIGDLLSVQPGGWLAPSTFVTMIGNEFPDSWGEVLGHALSSLAASVTGLVDVFVIGR